MKRFVPAVLVLLLGAVAAPCAAGAFGSETGLYRPPVPVSAFARPSSWLDPSRLHLSTEIMMGSGFGGGGAQGLQVTRLSYQLGAPLAMQVSLGNAFGSAAPGSNRMFLEGLDLAYRPFASMMVQFRYQDLRSPLQLSRSGFYDYWR